MTLKHTPGPWIVGDDEDSDYFLVGPHDGDETVYHPVVKLHDQYNAYLIAAAPELLEALQRMVRFLEVEDAHLANFGEVEAARASIAKATNSSI